MPQKKPIPIDIYLELLAEKLGATEKIFCKIEKY